MLIGMYVIGGIECIVCILHTVAKYGEYVLYVCCRRDYTLRKMQFLLKNSDFPNPPPPKKKKIKKSIAQSPLAPIHTCDSTRMLFVSAQSHAAPGSISACSAHPIGQGKRCHVDTIHLTLIGD